MSTTLGPALRFFSESQGNYELAVLLASEADDPPVVMTDYQAKQWIEYCENLSDAVFVQVFDWQHRLVTDYLRKLPPLVRKGGLIIAHDSSGQAHMMADYFRAITENRDLETVLVDASRWDMCMTHKMQ